MKYKLSRFLCLVFVFALLIPFFTVVTSASYDVHSTYVMDDLEKLSDFDLEKYTKNENEDYVSLIAFHEYGYDYNQNFNNYGLYVYLYNPSGKEIYKSSNTISLKVGSSVKQYDLSFISRSVESGFEHVFYKFKINVDSNFIQSLVKTRRLYEITSINISFRYTEGKNTFDNKYSFLYTGFDSYHGPERNAASTLHCTTDTEETVSLELHGASWKTDTSDKGINHQYEITSVYFAVPNYFLDKYGSKTDLYKGLYGLTAEWYEYKTNGLITNNYNLYSDAFDFENVTIDKQNILENQNKELLFKFHLYGCEKGDRCQYNYYIAPSHRYELYKDYRLINKLCNVIYDDYESFKGFDFEETKEHLLKNDGTVNSFGFVDDGRIYGYNKASFTVEDGLLNTQILNYSATHNGRFWHWLRDVFDKNYDNPFNDPGVTDPINVFHKVTASDFSGGTYAENAYKLFLSEADYENLKDYYNEVDKDEYTVYLLRFAVTDYVCGRADVNPIKGSVNYGSDNYYFEKTVFLQFDVLDMTFRDEFDNYVTLPVEADPIDILGTIDPPTTEGDPDPSWVDRLIAMLEMLISVIIIVVVVFIAFKGWDAFKDVLELNKNKKQ